MIMRLYLNGDRQFVLYFNSFCSLPNYENPLPFFLVPTVFFEKRALKVKENNSFVVANIKRRGDLRFVTSVRCYTRQDTATVSKDYVERPDTNASFVVFRPRETIKECKVSDVKHLITIQENMIHFDQSA